MASTGRPRKSVASKFDEQCRQRWMRRSSFSAMSKEKNLKSGRVVPASKMDDDGDAFDSWRCSQAATTGQGLVAGAGSERGTAKADLTTCTTVNSRLDRYFILP